MSARLPLSIMVGDYDLTRPLLDGTVVPQGVEPIVLTAPSPQRHRRMLVHREFDVAELSLGSYVARRSRGQDDLVAIPVFPHRRFRHGYVFASTRRDPRTVADLNGTAVGVRNWQVTAGIWLRGILAEHHGLRLSDVDWVAQDAEDVPLDLPGELRVRPVPAGRTVTDLCAEGELTGLIYPEIPRQVRAGDSGIRRLFADPKQREQDYFRSTGIFPIMHVVALRAELLERHPWLARSVLDAFEEAKRLAYRRLEDPRTVSLAWLRALQEEERALLGPDPFGYGLDEANTRNLETFLAYARQQGVAAAGLTAPLLFHPGSTDRLPFLL